jgi:hypothetical protein
MSKTNDVTIFYFGASGGFFALYMLLLSKQYQCVFNNGSTNAFDIKDSQWNITDVAKWKDSEIWPNNVETLHANFSVNKVYFVCNPDPLFLTGPGPAPNGYTRLPGKKLLLYTDLETQWYLAKTKRAYWFQDGRELNGSGPIWKNPEFMQKQLQYRYSNARLPGWPDCNTFEEFYRLPQEIQNECREHHHLWEVLDYEKFDNNDYFPTGVEYQGNMIYKRAAEFMDGMDVVVKLQDIIRTKGRALYDPLGLAPSADAIKFIIQYLSLHTPEQRKYLTK